MSQNPIVDDTKRKLSDLEQRIHAAKSSIGSHHEVAADAHKDWNDMVEKHAEISRKLQASDSQSNEFLEGLRYDIDILGHSFERWMARVEGNFTKDDESKKG
jgi:hypothetical protein